MLDPTSAPFVYPPSPGTPSEAETLRRQAFQAAHPEVGFAFQAGCDTPWVAYWLAPDGSRRHVTGTTMTGVLDKLGAEFTP